MESTHVTREEFEAMKADFQTKIDANSAAIDELKQLVDALAPELTAVGQDVAKLQQDEKIQS